VGLAAMGLDCATVEPQRTCIGCRQRGDKSSLVRLVFSQPSAGVVVDAAQVLPGRGCYLHPGCTAVALQRRAVGRALRVSVDPAQVAAAVAELSV
jgi:uncharacterized protein